MPILHSDVELDQKDNTFKIKHFVDEGPCLQECYESRMSGLEGDIENGKAKRIACIPRYRFYTDYELIQYSKLRGKDNIEANKFMDMWLWKNPEYRTTNPGSRKGVAR